MPKKPQPAEVNFFAWTNSNLAKIRSKIEEMPEYKTMDRGKKFFLDFCGQNPSEDGLALEQAEKCQSLAKPIK